MKKSLGLYFILAAAVLILDQILKYLIKEYFGSIVIINERIIFGFNVPYSSAIILFFVLLFLWFSIRELKKERPFFFLLGLSFIFGGGLSNFVDRILFVGVIDFIDLRFWTLNLADIFIFTGLIILVIYYLRQSRRLDSSSEPPSTSRGSS